VKSTFPKEVKHNLVFLKKKRKFVTAV